MPPPPQIPPFGQVPQSSGRPQPSPIIPQNRPPAVSHVSGTHPVFTHTPRSQVSSAAQVQFRARPQPSPNDPQNLVLPLWQVRGTQLGPPMHMLFWQVQSPEQAGQVVRPPQPSPIVPQ